MQGQIQSVLWPNCWGSTWQEGVLLKPIRQLVSKCKLLEEMTWSKSQDYPSMRPWIQIMSVRIGWIIPVMTEIIIYLLSSIFYIQSSIFNLLYPIFYIQSSIFNLLYSVFYIQSSIFNLLYSIFFIQSSMFNLLYLIFNIQSSIFNLLYSIFYIQSSIFNFLYSIFYIQYIHMHICMHIHINSICRWR